MRRIKHANVKRLALCKRGKNGLKTLYKSDGTAEFATMVKADEQGSLLAVMWPKGLSDVDGDFADSDKAIESMTSSLISNGGAMDIEHGGEVLSKDQVRITEVFTIQKSDPRFHGWKDYDGMEHDVTGGAAVKIQIDDPKIRAAYRDGDWDGVSLFGPAAVEEVDIVAASKRVAARMGGTQEIEMNKDELQAALAEQKKEITELFKSMLAELTKSPGADTAKEEPKTEAQPTFTGDVNDPDALAAYESSLRGFEMRKAIAAGKMSADDIAEMRKAMTELGPSLEQLNEAGIEAKPEDSKEVRALQTKLFKMQNVSNVPERKADNSHEVEMAKAQAHEIKEIAALLNANLGSSASSMKLHG